MDLETSPAAQLSALIGKQKVQTRKFMLMSIVLGTVVAMVALGLAYRQGIFERQLAFRFATPSGQNLSRGMPVLFKGFRIGYLDALDLQPDGTITGLVIVKQKHSAFVTVGSALRLSNQKIVTSELVLEPGAPGNALLTGGSELTLLTDGGIDALEKRVLDRVDPVLNELTKLIMRLGDVEHGVPSAVEALRVSLVQANTTLVQVNATLITANKAFSSLDERIKDHRIDSVLTNAEQTLAGLKSNTDQLNKTLASSQQLMGSGQQALQGTNKELAQTLQSTQRVLSEAAELMKDMRSSMVGRLLVGPRTPAPAASEPFKR